VRRFWAFSPEYRHRSTVSLIMRLSDTTAPLAVPSEVKVTQLLSRMRSGDAPCQVFGYPVLVPGFRKSNISLAGTFRSKRGSVVWAPR
jgi:hypothetical protein